MSVIDPVLLLAGGGVSPSLKTEPACTQSRLRFLLALLALLCTLALSICLNCTT